MTKLPDLSPFELQCLRMIARSGEATVRDIHALLGGEPSYSTVRTIIERLEQKRAIERVRKEGKAWVYQSAVSLPAIIRREIRRFLDLVFDGSARPLVTHLADMEELTIEDLRLVERELAGSKLPRKVPARARPRREDP